jgi:hypothetical protein
MRRVHICGVALLAAFSASAWADGGPYPPRAYGEDGSTKTRLQVVAEVQEAARLGLIGNGEHDFPSITATQMHMIARAGERSVGYTGVAGQSIVADPDHAVVVWGDPRAVRAKVRGETLEAARLGLLRGGEGGPPFATAEQLELIAAAGRRAAEALRAADSLAQTAGR